MVSQYDAELELTLPIHLIRPYLRWFSIESNARKNSFRADTAGMSV
jgi:hypothetical protein